MNITIIGTGYVGLVTGACLADLGNNVFCLDVDQAKIDLLNSGGVPIYEPGLKEVIERNVEAGRLTFSTDVAASVAHGSVQFIAVGTPPDEDGSADLQYVLAAAHNIGRHMNDFKVVVDKSTVPVGTADKVGAAISQELAQRFPLSASPLLPTFSVVSNPEFLKEGAAVEDFTRISFMNELANLAEQVGADIELVRQGIGSDPRIGYSFLYAGTGYGGSCFPKDVQALIRTGREHGLTLRMLEAVEAVNHDQKQVLVQKVFARYGRDLSGKTFALWGLAFKPNTNDMRDAPSRVIISALLRAGARIQAHDPVAEDEARRVLALDLADAPALLEKLQFIDKPMEAVQGADALIIVTEWKAYRSPNWTALKTAMKSTVIFDGRNLYEPRDLKSQGIEYHGIGRVVDAHR